MRLSRQSIAQCRSKALLSEQAAGVSESHALLPIVQAEPPTKQLCGSQREEILSFGAGPKGKLCSS